LLAFVVAGLLLALAVALQRRTRYGAI
jgi:hypothetical protein